MLGQAGAVLAGSNAGAGCLCHVVVGFTAITRDAETVIGTIDVQDERAIDTVSDFIELIVAALVESG